MGFQLNPLTGQFDIVGSSTGSAPTIGSPVVGGTRFAILDVDTNGNLGQLGPLTNGQLLIGQTGGQAATATLTGTANQIIITNSTGSITLSLPQSIATTSSPTFNNVTLSGVGTGIVHSTGGVISSGPVDLSSEVSSVLLTGNGGTGLTSPGTSGNVLASNGSAWISETIPTALGYTPENAANKGAANGYAPLDSSTKIPAAYLPSTVLQYEGAWNPNTNTPTLIDGTGTNGFVYYVSAAKSTAVSGLTDPSMTNFQIGDLVIYSSTIGKYQLTTPAAGVQSVNGAQGVVTVNAINQLTGDATAGPATQSQSAAITLASVNSTPGTYGSATNVPVVTVNAKGLVTGSTSTSIQITESQVTNLTTDLSNKANVTLSNLTSPTALNQSLLPGTSGSINLGTSTDLFGTVFTNNLNIGGGFQYEAVSVYGSIVQPTDDIYYAIGNISACGIAQKVGTGPMFAVGSTTTLVFARSSSTSINPVGNSFSTIMISDTSGNTTFIGNLAVPVGVLSATNLSGTNTGDVTVGTANGLSLSGQVLSLALASTSTTGALSSTDWNTFNSKSSAITGDIAPTSFTGLVVNTQNQVITGFSFANTVSSFEALVNIQITATTNTFTTFKVIGTRRASTWATNTCQADFSGDSILAANFSINSSGNVLFTLGNVPGFTSSTVKFRAITLS